MRRLYFLLLILLSLPLWGQDRDLIIQLVELTGQEEDNFLVQGFAATDRGPFLSSRYENMNDNSIDIPLRKGVAALSPVTLINLLSEGGLEEDHRVLIIGEEASYCATALSRSGMEVYLIDPGAEASAAYSLKKDNSNLNGWIGMAPFDFILNLTPGEKVPTLLINQLSTRGILLSPLVSEDLFQCWFKVINEPAGLSLSMLGSASVFPLF
ncbi:MAG: hypothetical protein PQJ59_07005 [Spirochaetales bacterium]|nr:hypothetical protein [Spirochaetales bacterium]